MFSIVVVLALLGPMGLQQCCNYSNGLLLTLICVWREFAGPYRVRGACSEGFHGGYEQGVRESVVCVFRLSLPVPMGSLAIWVCQL